MSRIGEDGGSGIGNESGVQPRRNARRKRRAASPQGRARPGGPLWGHGRRRSRLDAQDDGAPVRAGAGWSQRSVVGRANACEGWSESLDRELHRRRGREVDARLGAHGRDARLARPGHRDVQARAALARGRDHSVLGSVLARRLIARLAGELHVGALEGDRPIRLEAQDQPLTRHDAHPEQGDEGQPGRQPMSERAHYLHESRAFGRSSARPVGAGHASTLRALRWLSTASWLRPALTAPFRYRSPSWMIRNHPFAVGQRLVLLALALSVCLRPVWGAPVASASVARVHASAAPSCCFEPEAASCCPEPNDESDPVVVPSCCGFEAPPSEPRASESVPRASVPDPTKRALGELARAAQEVVRLAPRQGDAGMDPDGGGLSPPGPVRDARATALHWLTDRELLAALALLSIARL